MLMNKRMVLVSVIALTIAGPGARAEEIRSRRKRHRDQDRQHHAVLAARHRPTARSASAQAAYFRMINEQGGINGRKITFISYDDALFAAEDGRAGAQAGRGGRGAADLPVARHRDQLGDPEIPERQEGAAAVRRDRRRQMGRSEELPLDHGLAAQLPERRAHLRQVHAEGSSGRQDRGAVPERRFRQGLPEGSQGRARRQGRR